MKPRSKVQVPDYLESTYYDILEDCIESNTHCVPFEKQNEYATGYYRRNANVIKEKKRKQYREKKTVVIE